MKPEETKQKTPLTLMIEELKNKTANITDNSKESRRAKGAYVDCIMLATSLLPIEKKGMVTGFMLGELNADQSDEDIVSAEQYFNQTYTQHK